MAIDCNLLSASIGACEDKTYKGYVRSGWWTDYENIDKSTISITDNKVTFLLKSGQFWDLYDGSTKPFDGSKVSFEKSSKHGYALFNDVLALPLKSNTVGNAALSTALAKGSRIVTILEQKERGTDDSARYVVLGLNGGMQIASGENAASADAAWELVLEDKNTDSSGLFIAGATANDVATNLNNVVGYEWITGLTIGVDRAWVQNSVYQKNDVVSFNGNYYRALEFIEDSQNDPAFETYVWTAYTGQITVEVDVDKTVYFIKPDGVKLTSSDGVINEQYVGASGNCVIIVPKNSLNFIIGNGGVTGFASEIKGEMNTNLSNSINSFGCQLITGIKAKKSDTILFGYCINFTETAVKLILDNSYSLFLSGKINGNIEGNGATAINKTQNSSVHGISYIAMETAMTTTGTWTITIETV